MGIPMGPFILRFPITGIYIKCGLSAAFRYLPSVNNWFTIQCFPPQATTPTQPQYYYTTHCFVSSTIDIPPTTVSTKE